MTCFQRRHTDGQQAHEKMLNITDHQRKANQNHNEISPHSCQMAIIKKTTNRISLAVQWLRLCASNAGSADSILGQGTKIPHAAWHGQKIKLKKKDNK